MQTLYPRDKKSVMTRNAILTLRYSSKLFVAKEKQDSSHAK